MSAAIALIIPFMNKQFGPCGLCRAKGLSGSYDNHQAIYNYKMRPIWFWIILMLSLTAAE